MNTPPLAGGRPLPPRPMPRALAASLLLLPIAVINGIGFLAPVFELARMSFNESTLAGGIREAFVFDNWIGLVQDSFYVELVANSIGISLGITVATLLCSYPIALFLHRSTGSLRTLLTVLVISPLLTSAVVRTFGWIVLLADQGPVKAAFAALGIGLPRLMFGTTGVVIGLTEILMPYMILSLLAGFGRLDPRFEEAAMTLGAAPMRVFWRVILPLTMPGIALGCLLTFVLAVSSFITPKLLGGGRVFLLATEIYDQAIVTLNWPLAATLSILVLILFGLALAVYARVVRALD